MERLKRDFKFHVDKVDVMLVCAIVVVVASYALGYRLDWSQLDPKPEDAVAMETPASEAPAADKRISPAPPPVSAAPQTAQPVAVDAGQAQWDAMTQDLTAAASHYRGRVAVYLKDLKTGHEWAYHPDDLFPSASLIKVPVMICVFAKIHDGQLGFYDSLVLHRHNRVGGSGSLKWRPDGTRLTVAELLQHMISESDNTATNMLIEAVGLGYIQDQFPKIGLLYTGIYQEGMSLRGGHVAHENYTTAREMTMLMEKIYRGEVIDKQSSQLMLDILKHKKAVASRLAKGLPGGWEIAHKTGLLRHACHDSAIFLTPNGDYAMTVLTGQNGNYKKAKDFITRLGLITFVHYGGAPRYYASARRANARLHSHGLAVR